MESKLSIFEYIYSETSSNFLNLSSAKLKQLPSCNNSTKMRGIIVIILKKMIKIKVS